MFENSGRKLHGIAMVAFALTVIGAVLTLVLSLFAGGAGFFVGLISAAITVFGGWVSAVNLCAIADAAECSMEAAFTSREILSLLRKMQKGEGLNEREHNSPVAVTPVVSGAPEGNFDPNRVPAWKRAQQKSEGVVFCSNCGTAQQADRTVCYQCGETLHR